MESGLVRLPLEIHKNPRIHLIENLGFAVSAGSVCVMLELSVKCVFGGGQLWSQLGRATP